MFSNAPRSNKTELLIAVVGFVNRALAQFRKSRLDREEL